MTKHTLWPQILAVVVAMTTAALCLPQAGFSADKFEYMLRPFHERNFDSRQEFEEWLDDLGAKGWYSIFHFGALNPKDHQRLFMRRVGGPSLVVDFEIEGIKKSSATHTMDKWVPAYDKLGEVGKFPVYLFKQGKKNYAVFEIRTLDSVLQTVSWESELAGKDQARTRKEFESAANKLADLAHVQNSIGFHSKDLSDYHLIGIGETTPGRVNMVDLRFGRATISTKPNKWKRMINKHAKKGYIISNFELSDNTGTNFAVVFARVKVNGEFAKRKCVVEPIPSFPFTNIEKMVQRMNSKGKKGFEKVFQTFAGGISFQFILCKDK